MRGRGRQREIEKERGRGEYSRHCSTACFTVLNLFSMVVVGFELHSFEILASVHAYKCVSLNSVCPETEAHTVGIHNPVLLVPPVLCRIQNEMWMRLTWIAILHIVIMK